VEGSHAETEPIVDQDSPNHPSTLRRYNR